MGLGADSVAGVMDNSSNPLKWAFLLLGIALLATVVGLGAFYSNPVGIGMTLARQGLDRIGLERQAFEAPAGRLLYWRAGEGETVVLVHGMGNQAGTWVKVAADLSHLARIVVPDLPGHGDSAPYTGPLPLDTMVTGLAALVDRESPDEPVTLVGTSMGGWVSMLYAARHPERVAHLVLLSSSGLVGDLGEIRLVPETREEARALIKAMSPEGAPLPADFVIDDLIEKIHDGPSPRVIAGLDPAAFIEHHADRIVTPTDIVWGIEDHLLPLDYGQRLAALLPRARFHRLERCGHIPQQQCPRATVLLLAELLKGPLESDFPVLPTTGHEAVGPALDPAMDSAAPGAN